MPYTRGILFVNKEAFEIKRDLSPCPNLGAYSQATFWRVAFPLATFGAIASLSSERNAVNKSSALTMNRFPSRCASTQ